MKNNLTLKELGERTALSSAYLSNIENGKTSPTIDNLENICDALQYDLGKLLVESRDFKPLVRKKDRISVYKNIYTMKNELLTPPGMIMRGTCLTLYDNDDGKHVSRGHEHDEYFVLAEGTLKVTVNETEEYIMEAGDAIYIQGRSTHSFQRIGEGRAVLYVTTAMA